MKTHSPPPAFGVTTERPYHDGEYWPGMKEKGLFAQPCGPAQSDPKCVETALLETLYGTFK